MTYLLTTLDPVVFDAIGLAGFGLYVLTYILLTLRKLQAEHIAYFVLNGAAATMVLIGLSSSFNLASAMIQVFWVAISVGAVVVRLRDKPARTSSAGLRSQI